MIIAGGEKNTEGKIRMVDYWKDEKFTPKFTPLKEKLEVLAKRISTFGIFARAITFICLNIRLIFVYISDYRVYVCTGKTGTLTLGVMRVTALYIEEQDVRLSRYKFSNISLTSNSYKFPF